MRHVCKWCKGRGTNQAEYGPVPCPDCYGTGKARPRVFPQSFQEILNFAASLGWDEDAVEAEMLEDSQGEHTPSIADALEEAALDHIRDAGYDVEVNS